MSPPFPIDRNSELDFSVPLAATAFCRHNPHTFFLVLSDPADQNTLNIYRSKAENYLLKNLNRFGLEQLQADRVLDTLFEKEKGHTGSDGKKFPEGIFR